MISGELVDDIRLSEELWMELSSVSNGSKDMRSSLGMSSCAAVDALDDVIRLIWVATGLCVIVKF